MSRASEVEGLAGAKGGGLGEPWSAGPMAVIPQGAGLCRGGDEGHHGTVCLPSELGEEGTIRKRGRLLQQLRAGNIREECGVDPDLCYLEQVMPTPLVSFSLGGANNSIFAV